MRGPIVRRTRGGRIAIRRHDQQRLLDDGPISNREQALLDQWRAVTAAAAAAAPRFRLEPGHLLCLDNYGVFHGREAYAGGDRLLHRIWSWTDAAFGLPSWQTTGIERLSDLTTVTR